MTVYLVSGEEPDAVTRLQVPQTTCFVRRSAGQVSTIVMKFYTLKEYKIQNKRAKKNIRIVNRKCDMFRRNHDKI